MMTTATISGKRLLLTLSLASAIVVLAAGLLASFAAQPAEAGKKKARVAKIVFASSRTVGPNNNPGAVNNPTGDREIFSIKPDGTGLKQLTFNTVLDDGPVLSPNGRKVAYSSQVATGNREIFVVNADGTGTPTNLTNDPGVDDSTPDFSPSGAKIAYTRGALGGAEIFTMNAADGSGKTNLSNNPNVADFRPSYSPGGARIAYTSNDGDFEVFTMSAADGFNKTNLTANVGVQDFRPDFSPDGKKIAYDTVGVFNDGTFEGSNPDGEFEVYVMNASNGSNRRNLTKNATDDLRPDYSPKGTKIVYDALSKASPPNATFSPTNDPGELFTMNSDGSNPKNLTKAGVFINQLADWGTVNKRRAR